MSSGEYGKQNRSNSKNTEPWRNAALVVGDPNIMLYAWDGGKQVKVYEEGILSDEFLVHGKVSEESAQKAIDAYIKKNMAELPDVYDVIDLLRRLKEKDGLTLSYDQTAPVRFDEYGSTWPSPTNALRGMLEEALKTNNLLPRDGKVTIETAPRFFSDENEMEINVSYNVSVPDFGKIFLGKMSATAFPEGADLDDAVWSIYSLDFDAQLDE